MPGSLSLFGAQSRYNLQEGFPLVTTKEVNFKHIVVELLWFLKGDTNIKYLVDNGCNIWNEDAFNYYQKCTVDFLERGGIVHSPYTLEEFVKEIKDRSREKGFGYNLGDCGYQYGRTWRNWDNITMGETNPASSLKAFKRGHVDQIANLIKSLKETPESRRHIVINTDPAHDKDLALYWCHSMFQMNCRPIPKYQRIINSGCTWMFEPSNGELDQMKLPKYYLDCHMYQRSADVFLGVPYNIASYALLTHILAKVCNMMPGDLVMSYGDVHIYDNHLEQVVEQLTRVPKALPRLVITGKTEEYLNWKDANLMALHPDNFKLEEYNPHPAIKGKLSTGLK